MAPSRPVQASPPRGALSGQLHIPSPPVGEGGLEGSFPSGQEWVGEALVTGGPVMVTPKDRAGSEEKIPEVPVICAGVNAKPPGHQLFSVLEEVCAEVGCVCAEWRCLVGLRTSTDSRARL